MQRLAQKSIIPFALIGLVAVFLRLLPGERIIDDAYITYRYAENILAGQGFVYNPGERVLGTTTPLYTLLLAGLAALVGSRDFAAISVTLNALSGGAACVVLALLTERLSGRPRLGWAAGLLWALAPMSVTFAIGGMETPIYILLMLAAMATYLWGHLSWTAALGALALLTRPDALLFLAPLALDAGLRCARSGKWRALLRPAAIAAGPLLAWTAFSLAYFGSPLTNSVTAKSVAYVLPPTQAVVRFWQHYSTPFMEHLFFERLPGGVGLYWPLPGLVIYLSLHAIGVLSFGRKDSRAWAIGAYPLLYFAAFAIANPLIFRWYLAPPLPVYIASILGGLAQTTDDISVRRGAHVMAALVGLFSLSLLGAWELHPDHGPARPAPKMAWFELELLYEQVAQELVPTLSADSVIAAGDIGAVGYYSGARVLDTLGLVSPEAAPYYPLPPEQVATNYAIAADLILDQRPQYVVMLEVYGRRTLLRDSRFHAAYSLVQRIDTDIYGSEGMLVYEMNNGG